jgi:hypothetical protein
MAFLRTLKEGLWKCEGEGDQKHAWEESVKLREAMFWARIGGGVIFSVHSQAFREFRDGQQTETPPRTPVLAGMLDDGKLNIPKKRRSQINNPFLTPEKQNSLRIPSPLNLSGSASTSDDESEIDQELLNSAMEDRVRGLAAKQQENEEVVVEIKPESSPTVLTAPVPDEEEEELTPEAKAEAEANTPKPLSAEVPTSPTPSVPGGW